MEIQTEAMFEKFEEIEYKINFYLLDKFFGLFYYLSFILFKNYFFFAYFQLIKTKKKFKKGIFTVLIMLLK